jgi:spectinomycin phosphotransferase
MRDDPGLSKHAIAACLAANYGLDVVAVHFLPLGYDASASVYRVVDRTGTDWFLKVRNGPVYEPGLLVPRALIECGIPTILAPLPARSSMLWCALDGHPGYTVVLYPFIHGENAMLAGLGDDQWRAFGAALRAVHDSGLEERFRGLLRSETFALPSAALVRHLLNMVHGRTFEDHIAERFAAFWRERDGWIEQVLGRAEKLGRSLRTRRFALVLCHADIHAANILVAEDRGIWMIDWDGPLIAPRERDLLFVIGSRIARVVAPDDEERFFEGYGPVEIDPDALVYYRYERIAEDLGEFGKNVLLNPDLSDAARAGEAALAMGFFVPGGDIDRAETVPRIRWS